MNLMLLKAIFLGKFLWKDKIVLIDANSTVWQSSMTNISLEKLIKLPGSAKYFGYGDNNGFLFFIDGTLQKQVIKYDPASGLHSRIGPKYFKNSIENHVYREFIQSGQMYWMFSQGYIYNYDFYEVPYQELNLIWSHEKMSFFKPGPKIPEHIFMESTSEGHLNSYCYTNFNRSHFIFFAMTHKVNDPLHRKRVFLVDFYKEAWIEWPFLHHYMDVQYLIGCSALVTAKKTGERFFETIITLLSSFYTCLCLKEYYSFLGI